MEALYELKSTTLPCDQGVFYPTSAIHQALLTTYTNLRAWVNTCRPTIIGSVKDDKEQGVTHQQAIELYFPPQPKQMRVLMNNNCELSKLLKSEMK
jgi:hypothetical protein